jgi:hypothetical protein
VRSTYQGWLWVRHGRSGPPPPTIKVQEILKYASRFDLSVFVETGTYLADTLRAVSHRFRRLYSIELDPDLAALARSRFAHRANVQVVTGDSAHILPTLLREIHEPCLFWLDAHYSGGATAGANKKTPIIDELRGIMAHPIEKHVVLIDDARLFVGRGGFPTMGSMESLVRSKQNWRIDVEDDIIRITPVG